MSHSPIPWEAVSGTIRVKARGEGNYYNHVFVAECRYSLDEKREFGIHNEVEENARFIVEAANNYEAMKDAMRTIKAAIANGIAGDAEIKIINEFLCH